MTAIPIINSPTDINRINVNVNTGSKFKNVGATGPTGPAGPALTVGDVNTNITSYDKQSYNLEGSSLQIDNILNYKQCVINSFKVKIEPKQDFHGYGYPWKGGKGKNLYDKQNYPFILNQYINRTNGTVGINADFAATGFIPLSDELHAGDYITISPLPTDQLPGLAFYDNNQAFISGSKGKGAKIPEGAAFIRFTVDDEYASGDIVQLEKGSEPTSYVPYTNISPFILPQNVNISHDTLFNENYEFNAYGGYINNDIGYIQYAIYYSNYKGEPLYGKWFSTHELYSPSITPTIGAEVVDLGNIYNIGEIPRLNLNLPHIINNFNTSEGVLQINYSEYTAPSAEVSVTTDEENKANFDFSFSVPVLLGATGPQGIQGPTGPTGPTGPIGEMGPTGKGFAIERTYASIAEMNADAANVPLGTFALIASTTQDPDNAKLFVKNEQGGFTFLTDLSGSQGIIGPTGAAAGFDTPEAVAVGLPPGDEPVVSISTSGDATNKKFDFIFGIPQGATGPTGAPAGFNNIGATITKLSPDDNPTISVTSYGEDTAKNFDFSFGVPQGVTGPTGPTGNVAYATFEVSLTTGHLIMQHADYYEGPSFQLTNDGKLEVMI